MVQVVVNSDAEELADKACQWLTALICQHQAQSPRPFSIALAGGSTPTALYKRLAQAPAAQIDWQRVLLLWGDERTVAHSSADSNYRMVRESLLDTIPIPESNVLAVPSPESDPIAAAATYESTLRTRLPVNAAGWGVIDCVLLGMGDDVHTASLFPETSALDEQTKWVVANHVPKLNTWRITMTAPLLNAANQVAFLISGSSKTSALRQLWHGQRDYRQYPSQLIAPTSGGLTYFVDRAAVDSLSLPLVSRV